MDKVSNRHKSQPPSPLRTTTACPDAAPVKNLNRTGKDPLPLDLLIDFKMGVKVNPVVLLLDFDDGLLPYETTANDPLRTVTYDLCSRIVITLLCEWCVVTNADLDNMPGAKLIPLQTNVHHSAIDSSADKEH